MTHCMNDLSKAVKEKEQVRFEKLSLESSFAEPEFMLKYLDIEPGAVSITGLINDKDYQVQLLIDEDVPEGEL